MILSWVLCLVVPMAVLPPGPKWTWLGHDPTVCEQTLRPAQGERFADVAWIGWS